MIQIIPAIDLMEGRCVRLTKGDYGQKKVYDGSPVDVARQYADAGVSRIHLVDLDGAKAGEPRNLKTLEAIARAVPCQLEWGGGIGSAEALQAVFDAGATHAIAGSVAALKPQIFESWLSRYGARMILGADVRGGQIAVKGRMFHASTSVATMWFDGTTLWTYVAQNEEVNISTPTAQQLQTLNPYHFINLYKQGYTYTMTTSATAFTVHLTATDTQKKISEGFVTVDKTTYAPKEIKLLQGTKWTTFTVSGLKAERQDDAKFRFKSSDYPDAELIDLR